MFGAKGRDKANCKCLGSQDKHTSYSSVPCHILWIELVQAVPSYITPGLINLGLLIGRYQFDSWGIPAINQLGFDLSRVSIMGQTCFHRPQHVCSLATAKLIAYLQCTKGCPPVTVKHVRGGRLSGHDREPAGSRLSLEAIANLLGGSPRPTAQRGTPDRLTPSGAATKVVRLVDVACWQNLLFPRCLVV